MTSVASRLASKCKFGVKINSRCLTYSVAKFSPENPQNKLDEIFPRVEDFPAHHIGPRRWEAKLMLQELGYNVSIFYIKENKSITNLYSFLLHPLILMLCIEFG